jgi:hypothetical protein
MKRPALLLALLAVLTALPSVYAGAKEDFQKLPTTLDAGGCPLGDQSKAQERGELNEQKDMNKVDCGGMDWVTCIKKQQLGR